MYSIGLQNKCMNKSIFINYMVNGLIYSILIFFVNLVIFRQIVNGHEFGFWQFGNNVFLSCVIAANLMILWNSHNINLLIIIGFICSIVSYYGLWYILDFIVPNDLHNTFDEGIVNFSVVLLLAVLFSLSVIMHYFLKIKNLSVKV